MLSDDKINERVFGFLDKRGGYIASASERELFWMLKSAIEDERKRIVKLIIAYAIDRPEYAMACDDVIEKIKTWGEMDKGTDLDRAVERLADALDRLTPDTPEYKALWPEYDAAYRAWDEYHQTECPICRRIDKQLREMAHN